MTQPPPSRDSAAWQHYIERQVAQALEEDHCYRDPSSALVDPQQQADAQLVCKDGHAILCGVDWVERVYAALDHEKQTRTRMSWQIAEGQPMTRGEVVLRLQGSAGTLLSGERVALNFLQLLSGIATECRAYRELLGDRPVELLDTRKTLPNLRLAQRYAVRVGGGNNHRNTLSEAFMLKENHLCALGGDIASAVQRARALDPQLPLIVEVENLSQLKQLMETDADIALLDNFQISELCEAVRINRGKLLLEASGEIDKSNIRAVADTGVQRISVGALSKNLRAINFSMRFRE